MALVKQKNWDEVQKPKQKPKWTDESKGAMGGFRKSGEHTGEAGAAAALARCPGSAVWLLGRVKAAQSLWGWEKGSRQRHKPWRHLLSWHHTPAALATDIQSLWPLFQGHRPFWVLCVCEEPSRVGKC